MLDNKGKKTFLIVVLAVCAVSLVVALVSALVSALNMMLNLDAIYVSSAGNALQYDGKTVMLGVLLLGVFVLGVLFVVLCLVFKGKVKLCSVILSAIATVYVVSIAIVAYVKIPRYDDNDIDYYVYSVFETFLSAILSVAVPMILSAVSILLLSKLNDKEKASSEPPAEANS